MKRIMLSIAALALVLVASERASAQVIISNGYYSPSPVIYSSYSTPVYTYSSPVVYSSYSTPVYSSYGYPAYGYSYSSYPSYGYASPYVNYSTRVGSGRLSVGYGGYGGGLGVGYSSWGGRGWRR